MSKLVPMGNNIVIQDRVKEPLKNGIYIPDNAQEKSYEAVIIAVGPLVKSVADKWSLMTESEKTQAILKVGDVIVYGKFAGDEVTVDGEKYRILKETDILAKIV